jgi:hypothetical protein
MRRLLTLVAQVRALPENFPLEVVGEPVLGHRTRILASQHDATGAWPTRPGALVSPDGFFSLRRETLYQTPAIV